MPATDVDRVAREVAFGPQDDSWRLYKPRFSASKMALLYALRRKFSFGTVWYVDSFKSMFKPNINRLVNVRIPHDEPSRCAGALPYL